MTWPVDNFDDNSLDAAVWSTAASVGSPVPVEQNKRLEMDLVTAADFNYAALQSLDTYDLTGASVALEIVSNTVSSSAGAEAAIDVQVSGATTNRIGWAFDSGNVKAFYRIAGSDTYVYTATFNAVTHRWLRVRESGGTVYWDSSEDGRTWTNRASVSLATLGFAITALVLELFAGTFQSVATPGHLYVDNLNNTPGRAAVGSRRDVTVRTPSRTTVTLN